MRPQRFVLAFVLTAIAPIAAVTGGSARSTDTTSAPVVAPSVSPTASSTAAPSSAPSAAPSTASSSIAYPTDPATRAALLATFQNLMVEQRHLGDETRSAMLGSLTPAHRAFVASLVGQLATAPSPDPVAAARQIDAALSLGERLGVLRADANRRASQRELFVRMSTDLMARMSPDERAAVQRRVAEAQSDATRLTPAQRAALLRDAKTYIGIIAPGTAAIGTPQSAGELVLQVVTAHPNVLGI